MTSFRSVYERRQSTSYSFVAADFVPMVASCSKEGRHVFLINDLGAPALGMGAEVFADTLDVPGGEVTKTGIFVQSVLEWMFRVGVRRRDLVVIRGGGAVCDAMGFACSVFLRGVPYMLLPTTLVAQADAAIGGKVAINFGGGKNSVGAFWAPEAVIIDTALLRTLPRRNFVAGLAEIAKVGMLQPSGDILGTLRGHAAPVCARESSIVADLVRSAVEVKLSYLADDPYEENLDRALNLGHTIGHALEAATDFEEYEHGEAVAIGLATAVRLSLRLQRLDVEEARTHLDMLRRLGLPVDVPFRQRAAVVRELQLIKQVRAGLLRFVLPMPQGSHDVVEVSDDLIEEAMSESAG